MKSFFKNIIVSFIVTASIMSSNCVLASDGPQVLPNFASDRSKFKKDIPQDKVLPGNSSDPFEKVNRYTWAFNYDYLDRYGLRPIAHGYVDYFPNFVVTGVHNFLSNIREVNNTVNNAFVAEFKDSAISIGRLVINSTVGLLGFFDVAEKIGLEEKKLTFSSVLGRWGMNNGPYMQIPFVTMVTPRSILGTIVDNSYLPYTYIKDWWEVGYIALEVLDARSSLIQNEELLDNSFDPYISARDFYLQYQDAQVLGKQGVIEQQKTKDNQDDKNLEDFMNEIDE